MHGVLIICAKKLQMSLQPVINIITVSPRFGTSRRYIACLKITSRSVVKPSRTSEIYYYETQPTLFIPKEFLDLTTIHLLPDI